MALRRHGLMMLSCMMKKVTTTMASCKQRLRWAQGQFDCADRYIPKLFAAGIKQR